MKKMMIVVATLFLLPAFAKANVVVRGHYNSHGTYVAPYVRTSPDHTLSNNYSTTGNYNPYTGKEGKVKDDPYPNYDAY